MELSGAVRVLEALEEGGVVVVEVEIMLLRCVLRCEVNLREVRPNAPRRLGTFP